MKPSLRRWMDCAIVIIALVAASCSKQESAPTQQQPASAPETAAEGAAPAAAAVVDTVPVDQHLAQVSSAMKAGDYQTAATAILAAQKQQAHLTPEQAQAVYRANQALSLQLARSAGSDPKAKAALDMMRTAAANKRD